MVVGEGEHLGECHAHSPREVGDGGAEEGGVPSRQSEVVKEEVVKLQGEGVGWGGARRCGERGSIKTQHECWRI